MKHLRTGALVACLAVVTACATGDETAADSSAGTTTAAAPAPAAPVQLDPNTLLDPNTATREQLAAGGVPSHALDAVIQGRPYADMLAFHTVLSTHVTDSAARVAVYEHVWKPLDLNTAKGEEILLIPRVGRRMRHEFEEYRPYTSIAQFQREMGKYVDSTEVARLTRYVMIK